MIAALMLYSIAVTVLLAVAAAAAEQLLHLGRRPSRFVWAGAMIAGVVLTAARVPAALSSGGAQRIQPSRAKQWTATNMTTTVTGVYSYSSAPIDPRTSSTTLVGPGFTAPTIPIASSSMVRQLDRPLTVIWAALTLAFFGVILFSAVRLARANRRWSAVELDGVPVRVSHDLGPAVIGILRYSIVLPKWSLELPQSEREMVLAHEREHARAGDPSLLFGATLLVALMPWNAGLWWIARRLRFAIELDCDRRVLRHRDPRAYGALLLDVSERTMGGAVPIAAMAEPVSLIERRIAAMTARVPRFVVLRAATAGLIAVALVIVACSTPHPTPAPEPTPETKVQPPREAMSRDTVKHDYVTATIDTARRVRPPRRDARGDSLWLSADSALLRQWAASHPLATAATPTNDTLYRRMQAELDSMRRLIQEFRRIDSVSGRGGSGGGYGSGVAPVRSVTLGAAAVSGSGATSVGMPDGGYGRGNLPWSQPGKVMIGLASDSGPRVTVGALGETGSLRRTGAPPPQAMVAGFDVGAEYTVTRSHRIVEVARAAAEHFFPKSFAAHEGEFDMVTVVFDTTGAIVKTGRATRAPLGPNDSIADREQLRATLPGVSIESFSEWGMANLTSSAQSRSGVMLLYAFLK